MSYDRKAYSAEPQTAAAILGKRWEDLIDAAASATEEDSRDLTPVRIQCMLLDFVLTVEGAAISIHVTTSGGQPKVVATICGLAATVLHSFAVKQCTDATTSGHVRVAALPFCRIIHRVNDFWPKFPHTLARPLGLVPYLSLPCSDILCCLPEAIQP